MASYLWWEGSPRLGKGGRKEEGSPSEEDALNARK
jgi:hypothetical protein